MLSRNEIENALKAEKRHWKRETEKKFTQPQMFLSSLILEGSLCHLFTLDSCMNDKQNCPIKRKTGLERCKGTSLGHLVGTCKYHQSFSLEDYKQMVRKMYKFISDLEKEYRTTGRIRRRES